MEIMRRNVNFPRLHFRLPICVFPVLLSGCCGRLAPSEDAGTTSELQNGSFELGGAPCNMFGIPKGSTILPGWTVIEGSIDWYGPPPNCGWQASDGKDSLDLVGDQTGGIGGVEQTFRTSAGTTYTVAFDLAGNSSGPPVVKPVTVTVDGVTMHYTFDTTGRSPTNMGWTTKTFTFVASGTTATLRFVSDVSASGFINAGAALDNVRVTH